MGFLLHWYDMDVVKWLSLDFPKQTLVQGIKYYVPAILVICDTEEWSSPPTKASRFVNLFL